MRLPIAAASLVVALAPAWGQALQFNFDALAAKAKEKVEVDLSGPLLQAALQEDDDDDAEALRGVTGITVRSFEFDQAGAFSDSDLDSLRAQLGSGSGWSRIIDAKEEGEHTEIYTLTQNGQIGGLLIIAAEEDELTVVHLAGAVNLVALEDLDELVQSTIQFNLAQLNK